jgi:glycosyltransferase involved in cell wall biosynthesis
MLPSGRVRILLDYRPALRERTGVGEYAHQMAAALVRQRGTNDRITLFSSSWKDRLAADAVPGANVMDRRIPVSLLNLAWHRLGWPGVEFLGTRPDVVWSMHPLLMPANEAARVVTIHDLYFLDHPEATVREIRRDYARLAADHARRADGVIVVSEYTRGQVIERLGVPADRIAVCPNGAPGWRPRDEPSTHGPILHVGTVEPRKNVRAILDAYLHLANATTDSPPLVFAGRVESHAMPTTNEDSSVIRERVKYLGYVGEHERIRLYHDASMLVVASDDEGFGLPALEAMTLGVPVVATARGAIPEVVGDAALLVHEKDPLRLPAALASAMQRLLGDAELHRELRRKGIARSKSFDWNTSAAKAREALSAAIGRRGRN